MTFFGSEQTTSECVCHVWEVLDKGAIEVQNSKSEVQIESMDRDSDQESHILEVGKPVVCAYIDSEEYT